MLKRRKYWNMQVELDVNWFPPIFFKCPLYKTVQGRRCWNQIREFAAFTYKLFHAVWKVVADRSRNRVFRDCNSFRVPTETVALPGNIFGGVYVPGKYGKRVGFSRMLLQRGNVFIFKNNNCIISNLLELLFVHNYII